MIDYFALLAQPRRPWLDADQLKQAFHREALLSHPDAQIDQSGGGSDQSFVQLNEAYQVLQDPKRRLHHLLSLTGDAPTKTPANTPEDIAELFPAVAAVTQRVAAVVQRSGATTNALSRSLLQPELLQAGDQLGGVLAQLSMLERNATDALEAADARWTDEAPDTAELHRLYLRFSYLGRWRAELEARRTELATC